MNPETMNGSLAAGNVRVAGQVRSYILDTNVLLHDPRSIHRFHEHAVVIPVEVLEELDNIKTEQNSERGRNAREVTRDLERLLASASDMREGVRLPGGGTLSVMIRTGEKADAVADAVLLNGAKKDNLILRTALFVKENFAPPVVLVTKDVNMRLKARAVGLIAQDYLNDRVDQGEVRDEHGTVDVSTYELQRFAAEGRIELADTEFTINEYVLLRNEDSGKTMPARAISPTVLAKLDIPDAVHVPGGISIRPRNLEQRFLLDALLDPTISLVAVSGKAGTGKTLLTMAAAISQVMGDQPRYNQVSIARPVMPLGKDIGFLPGSIEEKMRPYLAPFHDALEFLIPSRKPVDPQFAGKPVSKKNRRKGGDAVQDAGPANGQPIMKPHEKLLRSGLVNIEPITYIRGRSIPRLLLILDECQQLTPLEVKTVVTRMSEGAKLIIMGDPAQIDNPYVDAQSNGLVHVMSKMKGEKFFASVKLSKGERSKLAEAASEKL